jgi:hypothetical protein
MNIGMLPICTDFAIAMFSIYAPVQQKPIEIGYLTAIGNTLPIVCYKAGRHRR